MKFNVTPILRAFGDDGIEAPAFDVEAMDARTACEVVFAVCNSYPGEMFCPAQYEQAVVAYRAAKHRSLSVGDHVRLTGPNGVTHIYEVAPVGFTRVLTNA